MFLILILWLLMVLMKINDSNYECHLTHLVIGDTEDTDKEKDYHLRSYHAGISRASGCVRRLHCCFLLKM
jgi:hypothetical protein